MYTCNAESKHSRKTRHPRRKISIIENSKGQVRNFYGGRHVASRLDEIPIKDVTFRYPLAPDCTTTPHEKVKKKTSAAAVKKTLFFVCIENATDW